MHPPQAPRRRRETTPESPVRSIEPPPLAGPVSRDPAKPPADSASPRHDSDAHRSRLQSSQQRPVRPRPRPTIVASLDAIARAYVSFGASPRRAVADHPMARVQVRSLDQGGRAGFGDLDVLRGGAAADADRADHRVANA